MNVVQRSCLRDSIIFFDFLERPDSGLANVYLYSPSRSSARAGIICGVVIGRNGERQVVVAGGYRYNSDLGQYIMRSTVDVFSLDLNHWRVGRDMPDGRTSQGRIE